MSSIVDGFYRNLLIGQIARTEMRGAVCLEDKNRMSRTDTKHSQTSHMNTPDQGRIDGAKMVLLVFRIPMGYKT